MLVLSAKKFLSDGSSQVLGTIRVKNSDLSAIEKKKLINQLFLVAPTMDFYCYEENHSGKGFKNEFKWK